MPLELSMPDLLRLVLGACAPLPLTQRLDGPATSGLEGDERHLVRGEPQEDRRRILAFRIHFLLRNIMMRDQIRQRSKRSRCRPLEGTLSAPQNDRRDVRICA